MTTFGNRLKTIRTALGLSQEEFGDFIGATRAYISLVEKDKSKLSVENLVKLLLNKNVDLNFLLCGKGQPFINNCENSHALIKNEKPLYNYKCWGKRLCNILSENEITPYDFSKKTGISESRIEKFILDSIEPTISEINAIKCNVDISIDELLYGEIIEKENTQSENIGLSRSEIMQLKQLLKRANI